MKQMIKNATVTLFFPKGRVELNGIAAVVVAVALAGALAAYVLL